MSKSISIYNPDIAAAFDQVADDIKILAGRFGAGVASEDFANYARRPVGFNGGTVELIATPPVDDPAVPHEAYPQFRCRGEVYLTQWIEVPLITEVSLALSVFLSAKKGVNVAFFVESVHASPSASGLVLQRNRHQIRDAALGSGVEMLQFEQTVTGQEGVRWRFSLIPDNTSVDYTVIMPMLRQALR